MNASEMAAEIRRLKVGEGHTFAVDTYEGYYGRSLQPSALLGMPTPFIAKSRAEALTESAKQALAIVGGTGESYAFYAADRRRFVCSVDGLVADATFSHSITIKRLA